MQIMVHLHVNKTNFQMKGFARGLAFKQRRKATRKSPIECSENYAIINGFYAFISFRIA